MKFIDRDTTALNAARPSAQERAIVEKALLTKRVATIAALPTTRYASPYEPTCSAVASSDKRTPSMRK
jgi:hypothetical protein